MREPPEFSVRYYRITYCDYPACRNRPVAEISLYDSDPHVSHAQVCGTHIDWAKADLVRQQKHADQKRA